MKDHLGNLPDGPLTPKEISRKYDVIPGLYEHLDMFSFLDLNGLFPDLSKKFKDHHYDIFKSYLEQKSKIHDKNQEIGRLEKDIEKVMKVNEELRKRLETYETEVKETQV